MLVSEWFYLYWWMLILETNLWAGVKLDKVWKIYGNGYQAVKDFNLEIEDG